MKLLLFGLLLCPFLGNAQDSTLLEGTWRFKEFYNSEITDSSKKEEAKEIFGKSTLTFYRNSKYKTDFWDIEKGSWTLNMVKKEIIFTAESGGSYEMYIIKIDSKELILVFNDNKGFIFEKLVTKSPSS